MILVLRSKTVQSCFLSDKTVKALDLDFSTAGFVQMMKSLVQSKRDKYPSHSVGLPSCWPSMVLRTLTVTLQV